MQLKRNDVVEDGFETSIYKVILLVSTAFWHI